MADLAAALAAIQREHTRDGSDGQYWCMNRECYWRGAYVDHPAHVAELQVAYLREHLTNHAAELGMARESKLRLRGDGHYQLGDSGQP